MGNNYIETPSFYNNEEYFKKYLGQTSYYTNLQNIVKKIISLIEPNNVLELGAALGTTSIQLAKKYPDISFTGTDLREDVVALAKEASSNIDNITFFSEDMCETVKKPLNKYDLIFLLYSFHHIEDPLYRKEEFLKNCFENMKEGSYLFILETFLPEELDNNKKEQAILDLWKIRANEGYASTYWTALQGLDKEGLEFAKKVALTSEKEEFEAGNHVYNRQGEYLIKFSWLNDKAREYGFQIVISEPTNCLCEKAILLRKF